MGLRWKIFFLALGASLLIGAATTTLYARSWQRLSTGYALLELQSQLERPESVEGQSFGGWILEGTEKDPQWIRPPADVEPSQYSALAAQILKKASDTRLPEGSFEVTLETAPYTRHLLAFRSTTEENHAQFRVLGLASAGYLSRLKPWLLPFGLVLGAVMLCVAGIAFALSQRLEKDYRVIANTLENIGAGRFQNLNIPSQVDTSLNKLVVALRNTCRQLEERDSRIAQVSTLAFEDPMTKAPNYRAFDRHVLSILSKGPETTSATVLAIVDLDFFKKVNDTYGHPVGDFVLQETARRIREAVRGPASLGKREADFFARYGGEEFALVLHNVKPGNDHEVALRVLKQLRGSPYRVPADVAENGQAVSLALSASIGIARWEAGWGKGEWVQKADLALYEAKHSGKNRVVTLRPERQEWV